MLIFLSNSVNRSYPQKQRLCRQGLVKIPHVLRSVSVLYSREWLIIQTQWVQFLTDKYSKYKYRTGPHIVRWPRVVTLSVILIQCLPVVYIPVRSTVSIKSKLWAPVPQFTLYWCSWPDRFIHRASVLNFFLKQTHVMQQSKNAYSTS